MKKLTLVLITLLTLLPMGVWGTEETIENITYSYNPDHVDQGATVTQYTDASATSITIPYEIKIGDVTYQIRSINDNAIANCSSLTTLHIAAEVSIDHLNKHENATISTFSYKGICYYLQNGPTYSVGNGSNSDAKANYTIREDYKNVQILSSIWTISVTTIKQNAFTNVSGFSTISIPETITEIGSNAFYGALFTSYTVNESNPNYSSENGVLFNKVKTTLLYYPRNNASISYTINDNVTSIAESAFYSASNLTTVTIGSGITEIPTNAFNNATKLTSVTIGENVTTIGSSAFQKAGSADGVSLNVIFNGTSKLKTIGQSAFQESGLSNITLPDGLEKIGKSAFDSCKKLASINIPSSVNEFTTGATFWGCTALATVTFAENPSLKTISQNAFNGCSALQEVTLPEGITTLSSGAFNPSGLQNIYLPKSIGTINDAALPEGVTIHRTLDVDFSDDDLWATYYSGQDLKPDDTSGLTVYSITGINGTTVTTELLNFIPANSAVLLQRSSTDKNEPFYATTPSVELTGTKSNEDIFKGSVTEITNFNTLSGNRYVLAEDKFVKAHQGKLPKSRCYLINGDSEASNLFINKDNNTIIVLEENTRSNESTVGTVNISKGVGNTYTLTITPKNSTTSGYYVKLEDITVTPTVESIRRAPGIDPPSIVGPLALTPTDADADPSGVTTYTFESTAEKHEVKVKFHLRKKFGDNVPRKANYTGTYTYDGTPQEPTVSSVTYNGEDVDQDSYDVSYLNKDKTSPAINAGPSYIRITGKREYIGTYDEPFTIQPRNIKNVSVTISDQTYTGSEIEPISSLVDKITENSENIIKSSDYTITYERNTDANDKATSDDQRARVNIVSTSGGNYYDTNVVYFTIKPKELTSENIQIDPQEYNYGAAIEPPLIITYNNNSFKKGTDYDVEYENNKEAGTATAHVTFKGNYTGTVDKTFTIEDTGHPQSFTVSFDSSNAWTTFYSPWSLNKPEGVEVFMITNISGSTVETKEIGFIPKETPVLLHRISGNNTEFNVNTCSGTPIPTGACEAFCGTLVDKDISSESSDKKKLFVLLNGKFVQTLSGEKDKLKANRCYIVADVADATTTLTIGEQGYGFIYKEGNTIKQDNDLGTATAPVASGNKATFTVKPKLGYYVEDVKVARSVKAGKGRAQAVPQIDNNVTVEAGTPVDNSDYTTEYPYTYDYESGFDYQITVTFHQSIDLTKAGEQPTIAFTNPTYNGSEQKVEPTVTTYDGNKLTKDIDYVLIYPDEDYTKAGKNKKFTVQGIRKYRKSLDKTFNIEKRNINMVTFSAKEGQTWIEGHTLSDPEPHQVVFTGAPIELNIADAVNDKNILTDDEATITYADDITNAGNTSVSVKSKGVNYQGEKTFNYTIVAKQMTADDIAEIPKQDYTGSEIKPSLSITYGKIPLKEGTDYEVTYSKNINAGEATATVTFNGNYTGKVDKTFTIDEAKETLTINFDDKNEWTTYYSDKNLNVADGFKTYVVIGLDGKKVVPHEIDFIPKEVPVLLNRTGDKTSFKVTTCSTKEMDSEIKPWDYFKGAKSDMTFSESAGVTRFVLFNNQFVQTKTGTLEKGRCYIEVTDKIPGVTTLAIGKGVSAIICMEEGTETTAVGSATVSSQPDKDNNMTLTINPKSSFYADKKDIKVVYSTDAGKSRAPEIGGGEITLTPVEGYNDTGKEYKYTFPYTEGYYYQITVNFHKCINFLTKETQPVITLEDGTYVYDGTVKKPKIASVKITIDGDVRDLKENKDFTIKYGDNNVNAGGNAQVIITGMNHYISEFSKDFTISQRNIKNDNIKVDAIADQIFNGSPIEPTAVVVKDIVKIDGKDVELLNRIEGKPDYTLEFLNNTHAGTATVNIIANSINYTGVKTNAATFKILPKDLSAEGNKPTIETIPDQFYNGTEIKPELVIKDGSLTIDPSNYDVKYTDNVVEGSAKAKITFKNDYAGKDSTTFKIIYKKEQKKLNVEFGEKDEWITYCSPIDLQEVEGVDIFVVTGRNPENPIDLKTEKIDFIPKNIGVLLQRTDKTKTEFYGLTMPSTTKLEGVTPDTELFRGSVAGIADIKTIEGIKYFLKNDNFIQVVEGPLPANRCYVFISNENAEKEGISHVEGNDADGIVIQEEGESNKNAGKVEVSDVSTDGYKTIKVIPAKVNYATKDEIKVVRSIKNETPAASASHRVPTIENTTVEVEPEVENADPSGTTTYKFKYDANYHYQVTVNFQNRINLSKTAEYNPVVTLKTEDIQNLVYDGKEKKPAVVSVKCNGTVVDPSNYDISYENNVNAGTPRVIITGKRFLMGSTHAEFSISKRNFSNVIVEEPIADQEYTGHPITPVLVVKDIVDSKNIVNDDDYELIFNDNIEVGTAKISLKPKNNYYGSYKDYYFNIIPTTGIDQVVRDEMEGQWFDLNGQRLLNRPTQKGVYILRDKNGKTQKIRIK